ncbi:hypothetical protein BGZ91_006075, partial [Linnemannia elongata]
MSSSPPQGNYSPSPPSFTSSKGPELAIEGQRVPFQLEHTASLGHVPSKSGDLPVTTQELAVIQLGPVNLLLPHGHRAKRDVAADVYHGPGDTSDARLVSSGRSLKFGFGQRLSRLFKRNSKVKETAPDSTTSSASATLVETEGRVQSATLDRNTVPASSNRHSSADPVETSSAMLAVPATQ